jgi:Holliday junction resolvase-like predicted endonuclease
MPEYYVSLVKEYLELQGFIVKTETKYKEKKNWGDIDIIAVRVKDNRVTESIVGEVKGEYKTEKEIEEINEKKFENLYVKKALNDILGATNYRKCLYCWSWETHRREYAEKLGIAAVSFDEIVDFMLEILAKRKGYFYLMDYPNLMLLQYLWKEKWT